MNWPAPELTDLNRRATQRTPRRKQVQYVALIFAGVVAYYVVKYVILG